LLLVLLVGGRWTRRNGRGDACAAKRQLRVKADWETRIATTGGCSVVVVVVVVVAVVAVAAVVEFGSAAGNVGTDPDAVMSRGGGASLGESRSRARGGRRRRGDESGAGVAAAAAARAACL
jgi:ABC-type Fe3+ transport system permease subunit